MRDSEAAMSSNSRLPSCPVCGAESWVITLMAPVYVTVDCGGRVGRVRVNDEAVDVWDTGPAVGRDDGGRAYVTCRDNDHAAPDDIAAAVLEAADSDGNWPGWEIGA